jgi:hypothetical protein
VLVHFRSWPGREALTTGGFGGFDGWLADARSGTLRIDTPLVKCEIAVADIGLHDLAFGREMLVRGAESITKRNRVLREDCPPNQFKNNAAALL